MTAQSVPQDAQSQLFHGHKELPCARMLLVRFKNAESGRKWLARLLDHVSIGESRSSGPAVHVAFTYEGLRFLGAPEADLALCSEAFREGMAGRAKRLRDPAFLAPRDPVHAVLTARFAVDQDGPLGKQLVDEGNWARSGAPHGQPAPLHRELLRLLATAGDDAVAPLPMDDVELQRVDLHRPMFESRSDDGRPSEHHAVEYFGFRDGLRQPYFEKSAYKPNGESAIDRARLAHFHLDKPGSLLHGGSYLVIRQLAQDVPNFWKTMRSIKSQLNETDVESVSEKVMGVSRTNDRPEIRPTESGCPFQSHARRVNPHPDLPLERNPGLIRRGMGFANEAGQRGLMFMALVQDIERQFEFIQNRWIQRGNHVGATSDDRDPVAGLASDAVSTFRCEVEGKTVAVELPAFVTLLWGDYFFAPTRAGLAKLAGLPVSTSPSAQASFQSLLDAEENDQRRLAKVQTWLDNPTTATEFWEFVKQRGGYRLSDGQRGFVFAPHPDDAEDVLADDGTTFSVSEYDRRMRPTTGHFFLGMDASSDEYKREQRTVEIIPKDGPEVQKIAGKATQEILAIWARRAQVARLGGRDAPPFKLNELLCHTLDVLSGHYFGLPGPSSTAFVEWGRDTANYHFRPAVKSEDGAKARVASTAYRAHVEQLAGEALGDGAVPPYEPAGSQREQLKRTLINLQELLAGRRSEAPPGDVTSVANTYSAVSSADAVRNLIGILTGSLAATLKVVGAALSAHADKDGFVHFPNDRGSSLYAQMIEAPLVAHRRGGPDCLYRQYRGKTPWRCRALGDPPGSRSGAEVMDGDIAIVWVGGALPTKKAKFLFGAGPHACPGAAMAIGMIEGVLQALASAGVRVQVIGQDLFVALAAEPAADHCTAPRSAGSGRRCADRGLTIAPRCEALHSVARAERLYSQTCTPRTKRRLCP